MVVDARAIGREVAPGTIWLVDRCGPVHDFRVPLVAACAGEIAGMIKRLVSQAQVLVNVRSPGVRSMAIVALTVGYKVPRVFAGRRIAVVAGRAGTQYLCMIDRRHRYPGDRSVAVLADISRQYVRRVLASRIGSVMAADAVVDDVDVIEVRRNPGIRRMAVVAVVAARYVSRVLAFGSVAIVAGEACTDYLCVVHQVGRREGHIVVAVLADVRRIDMRGVLAGCVGTVMAADAVVRNVDVVEVRRNPGVRRMAVVAVVATRQVRRVLAFGSVAIVAGEACTDHLRVIHQVGRCECHDVMAVFTNDCAIDVRSVLPDCLDAIMTAGAVASDAGVIEIGGRPRGRCMAIVTVVAAGNM